MSPSFRCYSKGSASVAVPELGSTQVLPTGFSSTDSEFMHMQANQNLCRNQAPVFVNSAMMRTTESQRKMAPWEKPGSGVWLPIRRRVLSGRFWIVFFVAESGVALATGLIQKKFGGCLVLPGTFPSKRIALRPWGKLLWPRVFTSSILSGSNCFELSF